MQFDKLNKKIFKNDTHDLELIFIYLNNLSIKDIPHDFINFETYEQIPGFKKKFENIEDCARYNSQKKQIEIFKEVITPKFVNDSENFLKKSFHRILFESINSNDFLKLIFIHEVAHYLQHEDFTLNQKLLNNSQNNTIHNFINKTLFYSNPEEYCKLFSEAELYNDSKSRKDTNQHLHRIVTEGFADSFSYIIFQQTSIDKKQSLDILEKHLNARKTAREANVEYYFTDQLLDNVLNDLKQGKTFNTLPEIKDYINQQIENYIPKFIEERLKKDDEISVIMNNRYLGCISKRLQLNNINALYQHLQSIGISNNVLYKNNKPVFSFNNKDFIDGIKMAESFITESNLPHFSTSILPEKTTTIKSISSLRKQFTSSTVENNTTKSNIKI